VAIRGKEIQCLPSLVFPLTSRYERNTVLGLIPCNISSRFNHNAFFSFSPMGAVSQVEHGVLHMLSEEDARLTVVIDCEGTTAFGFPVQMMKTCIVLVQENYPTRLASLFVINLSPVMHMVANTIMQVMFQCIFPGSSL
jgi:hypothetical protein